MYYVGLATDLRARLAQHQAGQVRSTKVRAPFELIYYEACRNIQDAARREKYLKSAWGKYYLKIRLRTYLVQPMAVISLPRTRNMGFNKNNPSGIAPSVRDSFQWVLDRVLEHTSGTQ